MELSCVDVWSISIAFPQTGQLPEGGAVGGRKRRGGGGLRGCAITCVHVQRELPCDHAQDEPSDYAIEDLAAEKDQTAEWDGVRNYSVWSRSRPSIRCDPFSTHLSAGLRMQVTCNRLSQYTPSVHPRLLHLRTGSAVRSAVTVAASAQYSEAVSADKV